MNRRDKVMLQKLKDERARLMRQAEALQNELRGLDRAIALIEADGDTPKQRPKNVKSVVEKIVEDAGLIGATVDEVLKAASNNGIHLERATVASNLSRGKAAGTFEAKDGRYFFRLRPDLALGGDYPNMAVN